METLSDGAPCLNVAGGSSLSRILETQPLPLRFYLTKRACIGILRRSKARGKVLPRMLEDALRAVAESGPPEPEQSSPSETEQELPEPEDMEATESGLPE